MISYNFSTSDKKFEIRTKSMLNKKAEKKQYQKKQISFHKNGKCTDEN